MRFLRSLLLVLFAACGLHGRSLGADRDIFADCRALGRGINFGNALEAPVEGEWGLTLKEEYFDAVAKAGFDSVRIPIKWSAHAAAGAPFTIDAKFFERIDWAIEQALSRKLAVVVNVHHYGEMDSDPQRHLPRLVGLWKQIADRYRNRSERVYFELLNEPHDKLTDQLWNEMIPKLLAAVRETNPRRAIIIGPGRWNNLHSLAKLELPEEDRRLIVTFHYYEPYRFTHQGAPWAQGSAQWKGTTWTGTDEQVAAVRKDFDKAAAWGKEHNRPLYLGEFGAFDAADLESRARWTSAIVREAGERGISTCYWEFGAGFGAFDRQAGKWREPLRAALIESN